MRQVTGNERGKDADFWRIRGRLPRETREYVPLMVAAALIGKEPQKYGLGGVPRWMPLESDEVSVPAGTRLATVAEAVGVTENELKRLNPHLVRSMTPPGTKAYPVRVPRGRGERFAASFADAQKRATERAAQERREEQRRLAALRRHTVRRGESLWTIARRYDTSVRRIQAANGMGSRNRIRPGQRLVIPS